MTKGTNLFSPIVIGGQTLPSRILLAPINTGFAVAGNPTADLIRFHEARSGPEIGISTVGNVSVSVDGSTNSTTAVLNRYSMLDQYRRVVDAVRFRGSLSGIQLASSPLLSPERNWVTSSNEDERSRLSKMVVSFSEEHLDACLAQFLEATALARSVGFNFIQIHAAHGYLLSLLLNPLTNTRRGRFSLLGPWLNSFVSDLSGAASGCALGFRLSLYSGLAKELIEEIDVTTLISEHLAASGVHLIDYSAGFYTVDRRIIYPGIDKGSLPYLMSAIKAARNCAVTYGVAGNVQDVRTVTDLPKNFVVSIGRALIADPDLLKKTRLGAYETVKECKRTSKCHYFSRGKNRIECGVNALVRLAEKS